ncbi:MAG: serine/threonine protein kinase [Acidobacteria bacterium]|nr:serine/threonine protein kinase [Acidobacteriota bacterium]
MSNSMPTFRNYQVTRVLGEGAMGIVYLAKDQTGRNVAIKSLKNFDTSDSFRDHFMREMHIYQNLIHPNLVIPFEVESDPPFIVMEYVDGKPLAKALTDGIRFELTAIAQILEQIGDGLTYVHQLGVIHGDLNPQNIMLARNHEGSLLVKILDFGIAKTEGSYVPFGQRPKKPPKSAAREGAYGTPGYIAPELFTTHKLDFRSDIFSFGVIAHELITGQSPFSAPVPWRTLNRPKIQEVTPTFVAIMDKALNEDPNARYDTAMELASALEDLFKESEFHEMLVELSSSHGNDFALRPEYTTQDILKWELDSEHLLNG